MCCLATISKPDTKMVSFKFLDLSDCRTFEAESCDMSQFCQVGPFSLRGSTPLSARGAFKHSSSLFCKMDIPSPPQPCLTTRCDRTVLKIKFVLFTKKSKDNPIHIN